MESTKEISYIWIAYYNPCVHESASAPLSLHRTKEGAEEAIKKHRTKKEKEYNKIFEGVIEPFGEFGEHEAWYTKKEKIKE